MPVPGPINKQSRFRGSARRRRASVLRGWIRDGILEERCLLTSGVPFPTSPPPAQMLSQVLYDGATGQYAKTITITNNDPTQYLYAFLEGEDSRQAVSPYQGTGAFDPYDDPDQEYRGYIGYTDGTTDYAGLPPLSTITITVPLAFWDSGRIIFSTDGADQFSTAGGDNGATTRGCPVLLPECEHPGDLLRQYRQQQSATSWMFTPVYNGFDAANGGMPTDSGWKSPMLRACSRTARPTT